ncbi:MAG: retropepsin-like aspartic protease [Acidobacteriota bacterium]
MTIRTQAQRVLFVVLVSGCSLANDVFITPLIVTPTQVERGGDVQSMVRKADFLRAIEMGDTLTARKRRTAADLGALGAAELAAGRYDAAREHLREAVDLDPFRTTLSTIAWDLSQVEYLSNNYAASLDWAQVAIDHGMVIKKWHLDYLAAMSNIDVYRFSGLASERVSLHLGRPDVPRIETHINSGRSVPTVIDSGAVLSIISQRLATELNVRRLKVEPGTFFGLLGEPISVDFGLIDRLDLGEMVIENVPVAIMPDEKMRFLITNKKEFSMDFLLGANLLKEFRLEFDFSRSSATFTHLTPLDRRPEADQNLFMSGFRPVVRGTVNRQGWYLFVLDTGSEVTFLNEASLGSLPLNIVAPKIHNAMLQGLGGSKKHGAKVENVEIGVDKWAGTFKALPMYSSSSAEQERAVGIIGENFMKNFRVVIDFGRMRIDLTKG